MGEKKENREIEIVLKNFSSPFSYNILEGKITYGLTGRKKVKRERASR